MINYKKYNVGDDGTAGVVIAGGAQGSVTVDLSDVYDRLNNLDTSVNKNKEDIRTINNRLSGLDNEYINHGGDSDDGAYQFGQVISDDVRSPWFFTDGIGFRAYWDASGYTAVIKDIGISNIQFTKVTGENTQLLNKGYTRVVVQKDNAIVLTNTIQGASVYFKAGITTLPAGATITEEHCYVSMSKQMEQNQQPQQQLAPPQPPIDDDLIIPNISADTTTIYSSEARSVAEVTGLDVNDIDVPVGPETINGLWTELYKDGQDWVLRLDTSGHECTYSLRYEAIIYYSNQSLQTYVQPYIKGNVTDNTTRYYGGTSKQTIATPTDVTVIEGNNGMRMTKDAILRTTDGGQTWTSGLMRAPVTLYETDGTTGVLGVNNNALGENWQLTDMDFSAYKYIKCYIKMADQSSSSNALTPALVITVPLDNATRAKAANDSTTLSPKTPCDMYIGGNTAPNPSDQNRVFTALVAIDTTKTKLQVVCENSLYGTAQTNMNTDGRYLYKIEGYLD